MKVFFLLIFFSLQAQEYIGLKQQLELEVKLATLTMRIGHEIAEDLEAQGIKTEEAFSHMDEAKLEDLLHRKAMDFIDNYERYYSAFDENSIKTGTLRKYIDKVQWRELVPFLKNSLVGLSGFFKEKGIGVALGIATGVALEYISYILIYSLNLPQLLPIVAVFPYGTILSAVPNAISYFDTRRKLIKIFGGKQQYRAYRQQRKIALKNLSLKKTSSILFPLIRENQGDSQVLKAALVTKRNIWTTIKRKIGLDVKGLNYHNLKLFLILNKVESDAIDWISESDLPFYVRTALISQIILESSDQEVREKFLSSFNKYIVDVKPVKGHSALKKWTQQLLSNPNVTSVRELMANLPEGVHPKMAAEAWEHLILPHYATKFDLSYIQYRKLKKQIILFNAQVLNSKDMAQKDFFNLFDKHLGLALKNNIPRCTNPEEVVLRHLLRGIQ